MTWLSQTQCAELSADQQQITWERVMTERNRPWDLFDKFLGLVLNFFAAVGMVATIAFFVGYFWAGPV